MEMTLSYGINCRDNKTLLSTIDMSELFELIVSGSDHKLVSVTRNLRSVLRYSRERYRAMKTSLPFFSCSLFEPALRSVSNFSEASGLVIDIDQNTTVDKDMIARFKLDPRILMGYISPSNMGIKLVFCFDRPVTNSEVYTQMYKRFSYSFATQYQLSDTIDRRNSDVSRISFICHDPDAWLNGDPMPIVTDEWVEGAMDEELPDSADEGLSSSAYRQILKLLETKPKVTRKTVPMMEEIEDILPVLAEELEVYEIVIRSSEAIQFGVKLRLMRGNDAGEVNLYLGRRGYRVVASPRKGTDAELNDVARHIIEGILLKY